MAGLPERRKSATASRTSCTLPHSAPAPAGLITRLLMRRSVFALRIISTTPRTVGAASMNCPSTPPGSISLRSPPMRSTRVEFDATSGSRPTAPASSSSPMAEMDHATTVRRTTSQTPRLTAILQVYAKEREPEAQRTAELRRSRGSAAAESLRLDRMLLDVGGVGIGQLLQQAAARVPAQHGVVVVRRADGLRALEEGHRLAQPAAGGSAGGERVALQDRLGAALADDAGIVVAVVVVGEPVHEIGGARRGVARRGRLIAELVGQGQQQHHQRVLVDRIDLQHVETDALGLAGLVQQAIAFGLGQRGWNRVPGDWLGLEHRADYISGRWRRAPMPN